MASSGRNPPATVPCCSSPGGPAGGSNAQCVALIVNARDYFAIAKAAIREARHAVMMIGCHFDLHIKLEPDRADATPPDELGRFLKAVAAQRPELRIHILQWDAALLATLARQIVPFLTLELIWHRRIHFRLDSGEVFLMDPWTEGNPAYPKDYSFDRIDAILEPRG